MTKLGYLIYFIVSSIIYIISNIFVLKKEINEKLFFQALLFSFLTLIFYYLFQKRKKKNTAS